MGSWNQLFAKKSLEGLKAEALGDNRLRRVLGPITLTSLGIGAIIGAGIFVMTGRVAALNAGPAIMLSFVVAGFGCLFAALCYAEFASMAPVAGSAYTYAYATLGELIAWIIGWDLILEYAMACACVAAAWSEYFNELLLTIHLGKVPAYLCNDPFSTPGAWLNLPAMLITLAVTVVLVIGIKESANTNALLVAVKVGVVIFVIVLGSTFVVATNWTGIPPTDRVYPEDRAAKDLAEEAVSKPLDPEEAKELIARTAQLIQKSLTTVEKATPEQLKRIEALLQLFYAEAGRLTKKEAEDLSKRLTANLEAMAKVARKEAELKAAVVAGSLTPAEADAALKREKELWATSKVEREKTRLDKEVAAGKIDEAKRKALLALIEVEPYSEAYLPRSPEDKILADRLFVELEKKAIEKETQNWGILGLLGLNKYLVPIDDAVRSPFAPYGLSGIIFGAAIVFFAYIGFDAISTHSEEARKPQVDVPFAILTSLIICTILYIAMAAVLTGMMPYHQINPKAAVANAFNVKAEATNSSLLRAASGLISVGALAGMTSVLLITFLSQARIFLAMARDKLLPPAIFGVIHPRFRTPHISTILTGVTISLISAFTPIQKLEEMVNIGTLMAFIIVCASVFMLRLQRPNAERPFRTPLIWVVAPLGILVNLLMMVFLPLDTWIRLVVWLVLGLLIYFFYGMGQSALGQEMRGQTPTPPR